MHPSDQVVSPVAIAIVQTKREGRVKASETKGRRSVEEVDANANPGRHLHVVKSVCTASTCQPVCGVMAHTEAEARRRCLTTWPFFLSGYHGVTGAQGWKKKNVKQFPCSAARTATFVLSGTCSVHLAAPASVVC